MRRRTSSERLLGPLLGLAVTAAAACSDASTTAPMDPVGPVTLTIVSGDNQVAEVGTTLSVPLGVRVTDKKGTAVPYARVQFLRDGGTPTDSGVTDGNGTVFMPWRLGTVATTQRIVAQVRLRSASSDAPSVRFTAHALAGPPAGIAIISPANDLLLPNTLLDTIRARVTDRFANLVPSIAAVWTVKAGGGSVRALAEYTDGNGLIRGIWTVGPTEGENVLEVGAGEVSQRLLVTVTGDFAAASVSAGGTHTCALDASGAAFCWGDNTYGQLGIGRVDTAPHPVPERVNGGRLFVVLVSGTSHTCGLTGSGETFCWGGNFFGQAGDEFEAAISAPALVAGTPKFTALTAGGNHTCGLTSDGAAYCWGSNLLGQLGDGNDRSGSPFHSSSNPRPGRVAGSHAFVALGAGSHTTCGITTDARLYCWGGSFDRELGAEPTGTCTTVVDPYYPEVYSYIPCSTAPTRVNIDAPVTSLAMRGYLHCAIRATSEPVCWSYGWPAPQVIKGARMSSAWVVSYTLCGTDASGAVQCWNLSRSFDITPVRPFGEGVTLVKLHGGGDHFCGITNDSRGVVQCSGRNSSGQVGDGTTYRRSVPVSVVRPRGG